MPYRRDLPVYTFFTGHVAVTGTGSSAAGLSTKLVRAVRRLPEGEAGAAARTLLFWAERATSAAAVSACLATLQGIVEVRGCRISSRHCCTDRYLLHAGLSRTNPGLSANVRLPGGCTPACDSKPQSLEA